MQGSVSNRDLAGVLVSLLKVSALWVQGLWACKTGRLWDEGERAGFYKCASFGMYICGNKHQIVLADG